MMIGNANNNRAPPPSTLVVSSNNISYGMNNDSTSNVTETETAVSSSSLQEQCRSLQQQLEERDERLFELSATLVTVQAEAQHEISKVQQETSTEIRKYREALRRTEREATLLHHQLSSSHQQHRPEEEAMTTTNKTQTFPPRRTAEPSSLLLPRPQQRMSPILTATDTTTGDISRTTDPACPIVQQVTSSSNHASSFFPSSSSSTLPSSLARHLLQTSYPAVAGTKNGTSSSSLLSQTHPPSVLVLAAAAASSASAYTYNPYSFSSSPQSIPLPTGCSLHKENDDDNDITLVWQLTEHCLQYNRDWHWWKEAVWWSASARRQLRHYCCCCGRGSRQKKNPRHVDNSNNEDNEQDNTCSATANGTPSFKKRRSARVGRIAYCDNSGGGTLLPHVVHDIGNSFYEPLRVDHGSLRSVVTSSRRPTTTANNPYLHDLCRRLLVKLSSTSLISSTGNNNSCQNDFSLLQALLLEASSEECANLIHGYEDGKIFSRLCLVLYTWAKQQASSWGSGGSNNSMTVCCRLDYNNSINDDDGMMDTSSAVADIKDATTTTTMSSTDNNKTMDANTVLVALDLLRRSWSEQQDVDDNDNGVVVAAASSSLLQPDRTNPWTRRRLMQVLLDLLEFQVLPNVGKDEHEDDHDRRSTHNAIVGCAILKLLQRWCQLSTSNGVLLLRTHFGLPFQHGSSTTSSSTEQHDNDNSSNNNKWSCTGLGVMVQVLSRVVVQLQIRSRTATSILGSMPWTTKATTHLDNDDNLMMQMAVECVRLLHLVLWHVRRYRERCEAAGAAAATATTSSNQHNHIDKTTISSAYDYCSFRSLMTEYAELHRSSCHSLLLLRLCPPDVRSLVVLQLQEVVDDEEELQDLMRQMAASKARQQKHA